MCIAITGAIKGIGRAVAVFPAPQGTPLVLVDKDEPALSALAFDLSTAGHQVTGVPGSVADEAAMPGAGRMWC